MNKSIKILILAACTLPGVVFAQSEQHAMSLAEAVEYALAHNQTLINAQLDVVAAEGLVKENIASGFPQINANLDVADNFELPTSFLPGEIVGQPGELIPVQFGTKYSGRATINASQMVFDGVFFVGLEAAKTYEELSSKSHIATKIDVVAAVTKAYYNVLVNKLTQELVDKNLARLDSLLRDTKVMKESGFAEQIEVSRVQVQYNNMKVNSDNSRKMLEVAKSLLKFQLGMPVADEIVLTDELSLGMFVKIDDEVFSYEKRIEYSILQTQEQLALLDIKRMKVEYLPKLDLYATVGAVAGTGIASNLFNLGNDWYNFGLVGLQLKIPIFDGLRKHYSIQQKKAKLDQVYNSYDLLKNNIDLELQRTQIAYNTSVDNLNAQIENMKLSEDVYNVTKMKYQQGVGSNIEVINADADYKEAQTNFFRAVYSALLAKVDYQKALGILN